MIKSKQQNKNQKRTKLKDKSVPRYHSITFLILPFIIYFSFNFSLVGTVYLKDIISYGGKILPGVELDFISPGNFSSDLVRRNYAYNYLGTVLVVGLSILLFNMPIKVFFIKKRNRKSIGKFIGSYTQFFINYTPEVITGIIVCGSIYLHASFLDLFENAPDDIFLHSVRSNIISVSMVTTFLILLLVFMGQKYRVQTKYIDHVFDKDRLKRLPLGFNFPGLRGRFFITTIFLTLVPLTIVIFYVVSSFSTMDSIASLSDQEFNLLFKDSIELVKLFTDDNPRDIMVKYLGSSEVPYINTFGVFRLFVGIVPGLFFSLIYVLQLVRWSNISILKPISELLYSMKEVGKGNLNSYTPVRSREETGRLSDGFNKMLDGLKDRDRIKSLFGQYLSAEVSEEILKGNVDLNGSMYKATILFADIRGFTTITEQITPHETIEFLNDYYNVIIDVIHRHGGIVDKFMGDGILVLFGVPISSTDHADRALDAAFEIHDKLREFNLEREKNGEFAVRIGIGIHTGDVIAGNVGNSSKLEYTVIGDTVNVASRIESLTKKFETELLIGESVYNNLSSNNILKKRFKKLDGVALRGKRIKVNLMALTS